jgi:hypothetical protein
MNRRTVLSTYTPRIAACADRIMFRTDGAIVDETHLAAKMKTIS